MPENSRPPALLWRIVGVVALFGVVGFLGKFFFAGYEPPETIRIDPWSLLHVAVGALAASALFFGLIVVKNPRWPRHVGHFLAGILVFALLVMGAVVTIGLGGYLLQLAYEVEGVWLLGTGILVVTALVGIPLAAVYLADILERNGWEVGKRTYLVLLVAAGPLIAPVVVLGAFTTLGQRAARLVGRGAPGSPSV